jgi:asparagine synthase (glutamine-hydrolysing)
MGHSYRGGAWRRGAAGPSPIAEADWSHSGAAVELAAQADGVRLFTWDGLALLLRGYARGAGGNLDLERVAEEIRCHYLEHGELAVGGLDGSFTLALLDGPAGRVLLYRNLVGAGFTYYHPSPDGLLFGSNLIDLVDTSGVSPQANTAVRPSFFLYRWVPGRETLFDGFFRLLPGEEVRWDARGLTRVQRHTFADWIGHNQDIGDPVEAVEATLSAALADGARFRPGAVNLLSGGIDSSYLQVLWNRIVGEELPPSCSVSVDHPQTWADADYAVTASRALGTRHTLVPADGPFADYLLDTLAGTGEPPNHVQTAYFGHLARSMKAEGIKAGLCGEGADSLFGVGLANQIHNATALRGLVPGTSLRRASAAVCGLLRWRNLASTFTLANELYDLGSPRHPVNRVAAFADWEAVTACFGPTAVAAASAERRALLDRFAVPDEPMQRLHAAGFLGEAIDSASLWTTLFNRSGTDLLCPFLDSRVVRLALGLPAHVRFPFRRPKDVLKRALLRHAPAELVDRPKLGFGQPIFEWLAPGGQLRPLVEAIGPHAFVDPPTLERTRARPTWFLYSLLCYDLWHRLFIDRSLPRPARAEAARREVTVPTR